MNEFTIDAPTLRRALTTAMVFAHTGKGDIPAINAVHVEPAGDGLVEVTATDRYVLSAETLTVEGAPFAFTMPYETAKELVRLVPRPKKNQGLNGTVTFAQDGVMVVARHVGIDGSEASTKFLPNEHDDGGGFPKYEALFDSVNKAEPRAVETVTFAPQIIGRVFKALADRDETTPINIEFRGSETKPALVTQGDAFRALVMRLRTN